jgi:hypothetical protein
VTSPRLVPRLSGAVVACLLALILCTEAIAEAKRPPIRIGAQAAAGGLAAVVQPQQVPAP